MSSLNKTSNQTDSTSPEESSDDDHPPEFSHDHLKGLLEALVFASSQPLTTTELTKIAPASSKQIKDILTELKQESQSRGVQLREINGGWIWCTHPAFGSFVRKVSNQKPTQLTRAQLESLAIVAYRQPITRPEIDEIRGVDSGPMLKILLKHDLIRILGKKEEPGRPLLYGTTSYFLTLFGLNSLEDLPSLHEYTQLEGDLF
ncbi:SMC-Scp complex subunit ScpB [Pajaroellobacter abortibovis]|uniref:SMC-Scp complex subunit ScpB n=1 Tax=Pajaroellobacter abortibovis TaxID=1882918 RepID=A0A1L6MY36_9BACT|nr:SMC-Scp complex subunit ScpB [Pajaroellobacter abortibovis]APS00464.1 SMC-Scp complex subunit ScpB [Pajaroellobacter abortibovis]